MLVNIFSPNRAVDQKEQRDYKMSSVLKLEIVLEERGFCVLSLQNSPPAQQRSGALEEERGWGNPVNAARARAAFSAARTCTPGSSSQMQRIPCLQGSLCSLGLEEHMGKPTFLRAAMVGSL